MQDTANQNNTQTLPDYFLGTNGWFYRRSTRAQLYFGEFACEEDSLRVDAFNPGGWPKELHRQMIPDEEARRHYISPIGQPKTSLGINGILGDLRAEYGRSQRQQEEHLKTEEAGPEKKQPNAHMPEGQQSAEEQKQLSGRPAVGPFPVKIFPEKLQKVINENAKHQLYRPDWLGSAILYAASVAVGNCYGTRFKSYEQKATLYLAIVGQPGTNKSGPFEYAIKPLRNSDAATFQLYKQKKKGHEEWLILSKKEREAQGLPLTMERPIYQTILVSDVTPEALVDTHENNPIGLGLAVDELAAWFNNFNRYSSGSEQQNWLSNWALLPFKSLRLSRGANVIDRPSISVGGTIQPGILGELTKELRGQNGFVDRIIFAYPDEQKKPYDSDTQLDENVTADYWQCINKLLALREAVVYGENGEIVTKWIPFSDDALKAMRKWRNKNTDLANGTEKDALKGVYAKLDVYIIRFCLILELLDYSCNQADLSQIRLTTVERAAKLTEYFRQNAEKVHYELNEQEPSDRLPADQQRLFNALPDEITTAEAIGIGANLTPSVSESTVKRLLRSQRVFKRTAYGAYVKL